MSIIWLVIKTIGSLFVVACGLRAYLQMVRLHAQNPVSRATFRLTDWVVLPIRRLLPGFGGVDWASLLASLLLSLLLVVGFFLLTSWGLLGANTHPDAKPVAPFGWLVVLAVVWMLGWLLQLGVVILIAMVAISWINPMHPLKPVFDLLSAPMLAPFRALLGRSAKRGARQFGAAKTPSGFDWSPIGAFLMLQVAAALLAELELWVMRALF